MDFENFKKFIAIVQETYEGLSQKELFTTSLNGDDFWLSYLSAFPEGANPHFRERTFHDCSADRNFIKFVGPVVGIHSGKMVTVWSRAALEAPYPYDKVAETLDEIVRSSKITSIFRSKEPRYGVAILRELLDEDCLGQKKGSMLTWYNFEVKIRGKYKTPSPRLVQGEAETTVEVFRRGLDTITFDALTTVIELVEQDVLYRGKEFIKNVKEFLEMKNLYSKLNSASAQELFVWENYEARCSKIRNSAIGTLLQNLSEGLELEKALKAYETVVAPANYKRPKSPITKAMVEKANKTLEELGLENSIFRRFARPADVDVNAVLYTDSEFRGNLKGGLMDLLGGEVKQKTVKFENPVPISIEEFLSEVVPNAQSMEALVHNHQGRNFFSLTAPQNEDSGQLFKWGNDFAWSYEGGLADSELAGKVAAAGGRIDGAFRFSHMWNYGKRNASLMDLHVFLPASKMHDKNILGENYGGTQQRVGWNARKHSATGGVQDVDYTNPAPEGYIPVENITFPSKDRMPDGDYVCKIHNWAMRNPNLGGFKAEIAFDGEVYQYEYDKPLANKEWVTVAVVTKNKGEFTIRHLLPCGHQPSKKWGVNTETLTRISTVFLSPNHWGENKTGAKHWFFALEGCRNPEPVRGFYNEFLSHKLHEHRKVFEILGSKIVAQPTDDQLSGVGFTSGRGDSLEVQVQLKAGGRQNYKINF